ncbi:hypothetical protein TNCV_4062831 [Trichonephila clavipes]|nr:hypothetical protein TNCV_4062831 [Trichonephila clavipes]
MLHQLTPKTLWIKFPSVKPWPNGMKSTHLLNKLDRLKLAIDQKRPDLENRRGVEFHQDNQRQAPHVCSESPETLGASLGSFNASTI